METRSTSSPLIKKKHLPCLDAVDRHSLATHVRTGLKYVILELGPGCKTVLARAERVLTRTRPVSKMGVLWARKSGFPDSLLPCTNVPHHNGHQKNDETTQKVGAARSGRWGTPPIKGPRLPDKLAHAHAR
jgi:hypothetical protein